MKINVNGYEVEITAKRGDKDDTLYFLNDIALAYRYANLYNTQTGCPALANKDREICNELYDICYKAGLYEG